MKKPTPDVVNHPPHYTGKIECIDAIDEVTQNLKGEHGYYTGTIIKYIWRWYRKNGVEDLRKAQWYLTRLIEKVSNAKVTANGAG